ncbi:hypothetical protein PENDEC_c014G04349 [Penicillium decumbens]|uniref:Class II aldolase/adducin N-terminal domain-containing protein n=1 Tax=Penicillium decumbens TaxID=69771 RepID=A0A1V6P999_PENDC|nr:hypothetical protein PENDEC_c014G04349 [Penicillium decumbens]
MSPSTTQNPVEASIPDPSAMGASVHSRAQPEQVESLGKTKDGRALKIRTYPIFRSLLEERIYRKQHLAAAFRVFADRGFDEGVAGHISVRDPILTDHFCKSVREIVGIHKARPDVHAACHAHSVYGKAFSCFGRKLEMLTQDSLRFYNDHAIYNNFGGVVVDKEEGDRIAKSLGNCKAVILQNHGLLTVGQSVDEAAFWFISLDKTCQAQLLADAAAAGSGHKKITISEEEAEYSKVNLGGPDKGWLAFQPYYDEQLAKTNGHFLG